MSKPPEGQWKVWAFLAGRGAGTTRTGAEWLIDRAKADSSEVMAIVSPTLHRLRDVMLGGQSGILKISSPEFMPTWERSKHRLVWPNGARAVLASGGSADRLRGVELSSAWVDDIDTFRTYDAIDNLMVGLRRGDDPRACITGRPAPQVLGVLARLPGVVVGTALLSMAQGRFAASYASAPALVLEV